MKKIFVMLMTFALFVLVGCADSTKCDEAEDNAVKRCEDKGYTVDRSTCEITDRDIDRFGKTTSCKVRCDCGNYVTSDDNSKFVLKSISQTWGLRTAEDATNDDVFENSLMEK